jgi:hypothetical protein
MRAPVLADAGLDAVTLFGALGGALIAWGLMMLFGGKAKEGAALVGSGVTVFGFGMTVIYGG